MRMPEAARCHGGKEREMEDFLGDARVHVRRDTDGVRFAHF